MFGWFKKENWEHVKTLTIDGVMYDSKKGGKVFVHLYESDKGNRKIKSASSFADASQNQIDKFVHSNELYQLRLERWLAGRRDPEIPRYSQVGEEDTANALRGSVD